MCRKTCWDNASMESCNGILKTEALYSRFGKTKVKDRRIPIAKIVKSPLSACVYKEPVSEQRVPARGADTGYSVPVFFHFI
jgi:hypothetical protein